ncbi:hypothetical protein EVAR_79685_1 [Eumeta japonica]|uniref:Uncharacterized protein n=1 Tax=Eumeta variegata TaxID=151549 RepID=A0A4C1TA13_EUMVA|nr:hypothetical protein EVAR_79685_1 [Eumeta japonica]
MAAGKTKTRYYRIKPDARRDEARDIQSDAGRIGQRARGDASEAARRGRHFSIAVEGAPRRTLLKHKPRIEMARGRAPRACYMSNGRMNSERALYLIELCNERSSAE